MIKISWPNMLHDKTISSLRILKKRIKQIQELSHSMRYWFSRQQILFSAESGIYRWQSHRSLFRTSLKIRVKRQKQPLFTGKHRNLFLGLQLLKSVSNTGIFLKPVQISPGLPFFDNLTFLNQFGTCALVFVS